MKHLKSFLESNLHKKTLGSNNYRKIDQYLSSINLHWIYSSINQYQKRKIKLVEYKAFITINKKDEYINIEFDNEDSKKIFIKNFTNDYSNNIESKNNIVKIYINEKIDTNYIKSYVNDIEDTLLELEEIGYKLRYAFGTVNQNSTYLYEVNPNNNSDITGQSADITVCQVIVQHKSEINENDDEYEDDDEEYDNNHNLDMLKREEEFIKSINLYKTMVGVIKRLQSFNLRVKFRFTRFKLFELTIFCEHHEYYNDVELF